MALDVKVFESISPSRFLTFTIPRPELRFRLLRVAVLDSPFPPLSGSSSSGQQVAALFVPLNRESDWVFSTESGHLQLLLSFPGISRLVLIGRDPVDEADSSTDENTQGTQYLENLRCILKPLLEALSPKTCENGIVDVPIWEYVDNVIHRKVLDRRVGDLTGEMLVEDVELQTENVGRGSEFRRRLRFKRMPNLVQTEIRVTPGEFGKPEIGVLVQPYLVAMVASLSLIVDCMENGVKSKALCLGVGGGALLSFLRSQLGFQVCGVEMDQEVVGIAKQYFGLDISQVNVHIDNALDFVDKLVGRGSHCKEDCCCSIECSFDVIMVDLDSSDARNGISAPPVEFIDRDTVSAARTILADHGILVMNVVPSIRMSYDNLIEKCRGVFSELYEIDVGNGENFILVAKKSPVLSAAGDCSNNLREKLKGLISMKYLDSIRKI
ncbi:eEF1A lysine and N-terminal methyltransferase [Linum grandiflorum]